jgi:DNA primase catalytic core
MITDIDKQKIKDAADIVAVIEGCGVNLKKAGAIYKACCPFHTEETPSFCVSPARNTWHCFGACDTGGDVISFLMKMYGWSYPEACRWLAEKYNITLEDKEQTAEEVEQEKKRDSMLNALAEAQKIYVRNLTDNIDNKGKIFDLLEKRGGYQKETLETFGVGFAASDDEISKNLIRYFSQETLTNSDLVYYHEAHRMLNDKFRQRLMFPFYNLSGKIIGYTGRTIILGLKPKYSNTGETELFTKGNQIWGFYQARKEIARQDKVYLVEGQFDVISCYDNGLHNVVAFSGTALTEQQRKTLYRMTHNVTLMFDGDEAGQHATLKHTKELLNMGFNVRCVLLPEGKDPDEFTHSSHEEFPIWVKNHEISFVEYMCMTMLQGDDIDQAKAVDEIMDNISMVKDNALRDKYIKRLSKLSTIELEAIKKQFKTHTKANSNGLEENKPRFVGIEEAKLHINEENDAIEMTTNWEQFYEGIEQIPIVMAVSVPSESDIQALRELSSMIHFTMPDENVSQEKENEEILLLKALYKQGYQISIKNADNTDDFIAWYVKLYTSKIEAEEDISEMEQDIYIDRVAEMIAFAPQTKRVRSMKKWADGLGISEKALRDSVKVTLDKGGKKKDDPEDVDFDFKDDAATVPNYVYENTEYEYMLRRFHFYPRLNKKDEPCCYMFRQGDSESYHRVCDFFMEPLIHIYDKDPNENKRIVKLYSINKDAFGHYIKPKYVEWQTDTFGTLQNIKLALKREGPYNTEHITVKSGEWDAIENWMSLKFKQCYKLNTLGQQREGFFAFSNKIFCQNEKGEYELRPMNNLGLVEYQGCIYYCPAFSEIYLHDRREDDPYEQDKWLFYQDVPENKQITFEYWARLFDEVYKINDNGKWGILFAIMSAFRSDIFPKEGKFTALFFMGQTASGKSQIAISIRSLYIKPNIQVSNLNGISEAAFFSILERYRDIPWLFDEYNDNEISAEKFQGLKALVYDGNSKQKRRSATGNDIISTKVNTSIILMGQEAPQRDDNALANRVVLCEVPPYNFKNDEHAVNIFNELKNYEKEGLSYLLCEILKIRPVVQEKFVSYQTACEKELSSKIGASDGRSGDQTRIITTVSFFLAICKIIEDFCPALKLPFTYQQFLPIAVDKVNYQVEMLSHTDKVSSFFSAMDSMFDRHLLLYGREFRVETSEALVHLDQGDKMMAKGSKILYMNVKAVYDLYKKDKTTDEPISKQTLTAYLKANPSFIGTKKGIKFTWKEPQYENKTDGTGKETEQATMTMVQKTKNTSCYVFDYDRLSKDMEIDLIRDNTNEKIIDESSLPF